MTKYREILRLAASGHSQRDIAASCGCTKSTVGNVVAKAEEVHLCWPLEEELDDRAIKEILYGKRRPRTSKCPIDHERVEQELAKKGVTRELLWREYAEAARSVGSDFYSYPRFCELHRAWVGKNSVTMHIEHLAAEEMQVDWVGMTAEVIDPDTGEVLKVYVFVAVLAFSGMIYAEGFFSTDEASWIEAHVNAFSFYGGTPLIVRPDNCKTAVSKRTKDELILNEQYRRMAEYYELAIVPARVRRPKDKASIEMVARIIEQQALAPLRNTRFLSLRDFNEALAQKVDWINGRPFQKRSGSREEVFLTREKPLLKALPPEPYRMVERKMARVQFNYHVAFDNRFYSVPHTYVGSQVTVVATKQSVSILADGKRVATHERSYGPPQSYVTDEAHMPDSHRQYVEWSAGRFIKWAETFGNATAEVVRAILASRKIEQHAYRSVRALLCLADKFGGQTLEWACETALSRTSHPNYKLVKSILEKQKDPTLKDDPVQAYVRGSDFYKDI